MQDERAPELAKKSCIHPTTSERPHCFRNSAGNERKALWRMNLKFQATNLYFRARTKNVTFTYCLWNHVLHVCSLIGHKRVCIFPLLIKPKNVLYLFCHMTLQMVTLLDNFSTESTVVICLLSRLTVIS